MGFVAKLAHLSFHLFRRLPPITWPEIEAVVRRAYIGVHPRVYGYIHYMTMLLGAIASLPFALLAAHVGVPPVLVVLTGAFLGLSSSIIYPYLRANSMASAIESRLVAAVGLMALLALAGRNVDEIFYKVARVEGRDKPLSRVLLRYVRNVKLLGMDYMTAMRDVVATSPSHRLGVLIASIHEAIETAGNPASYLLSEFRSMVAEKRARLARSLASIGHLSEAFIILVLLGPAIAVLTAVLGGTMGLGFAGLSPQALMALMVLGVIPFATIGMLIFLDAVLSEAETV